MGRNVVDWAAVEHDLTMGNALEASKHHQAGSLAGSGRAEHGHELSPADIEVEVFDDKLNTVIALLDTVETNMEIICFHGIFGPIFSKRQHPRR